MTSHRNLPDTSPTSAIAIRLRGARAMRHLVAVWALFVAACASHPAADPGAGAPTTAELGRVHFAVSTKSPAAQQLFDQGLAWCYGFHHDEALRCFREALAIDPSLAMAHWGLAYAAGPHINNMAMSPEANAVAAKESALAALLAAGATPVEQALIAAVARRYAVPPPDDRAALDRAYADAMRAVHAEHGANPHVAALFAEALMNLRPWDLWRQDGSPQPGTDEVLAVLESLLAAHPDHPQANHLYIHAVEASLRPDRAIPCAERLVDLAPAAGHLVHMPSHVLLRVGRYEEAADANRKGIVADLAIVRRTGRSGFYEVYRAHNYHFLVYAAMFAGRDEEAIAAAREMVAQLPMDVVQQVPEFLEAYLAVPYHALVRFGRWQQMLDEPPPPAWQRSARAVWHYGRGIALAALGRVDEARAEQAAFATAFAAVPGAWTLGNNPTRTVLAIGERLLAGEIAFRAGDRDGAFAALREAVAAADALRYDEPWGWMVPPRHALGALLLEAGDAASAADVYRADLALHPDNGWSLHGLAECQSRLGAATAAAATTRRFEAAWRHATVRIDASCFCRRDD
jgi:tetratricopeptide (TPR) repeat protein